VPAPLPDEPEEEVELEYPLFQVEPLLFVLRGALDRLAARLAERGVVFGAVVLRLRLEGGEEGREQEPPRNTEEHGWGRQGEQGRGKQPPKSVDEHRGGGPGTGSGRVDERWLSLAAPMRDVPSILALWRVSIESSPPRSAVLGLAVRAVPAASRPGQLSLFERAGPAPEKLAVALARLAALVGPERVGTPVVPDAHRSAAPLPLRVLRPPLPAEILPHGEEPPMATDGHRFDLGQARGHKSPIRVHPCSSVASSFNDPPRRPTSTAEPQASAGGGPCRLSRALKGAVRLRPVRGLLSSFRLRTADHRLSGDIRRVSGPWKLRSGWWSASPVERDYYDAELSSGALVRLYRDVLADVWFVDGIYD
jgi:hypothetical protein